ncbi:MAG: transposase [Isosphaeraceae bacterium]
MRKSTNTLTPAQVYRYAVQAFQPHLKLRDTKKVAGQMILTVLFAAAARISSLSDTCRRLRGVPDEHIVAEALYSTLPSYNVLRREVQAALHGHLPKALRRRPQVVAADLTLLPYYGADAKTNPLVVRGKAKKGTCSFFGYGTAYVIHKGRRYTVALTAVTRDMTMADLVRILLQQVRAAGIQVRFLVLDREFYSVAVIRYLQAARVPFLMPVVCHGRPADHPLGPSGSNVFKQCKKSGWSKYTLRDAAQRTATVLICVKCRNRRGERGKQGREAWIYAYWGLRPKRFDWVKETYRRRFGIETSYRQMNQCRIRTTTTRFEVRFLYVAIAFLLRNLWVWLHHAVLSKPRRGGAAIRLERLRLKTMLLWLFEVAVGMYGLVNTALTERPLPKSVTT